MQSTPIRNIIFGTMTLGYRGYGARVHDPAVALAMLDAFEQSGHRQIDTAEPYGDGTCEEMLGELGAANRFDVAVRFSPGPNGNHEPEVLKARFRRSLARLNTDHVQILYLSVRDPATPLEATLRAVDELHREGRFDELGLSNMSAWEVAAFAEAARRGGFLPPTVYQGMYNAITRAVEPELFPSLGYYGLRFHAYNPLAGGAFAPSFGRQEAVAPGSRFDESLTQGKVYRQRYWNAAYLDALSGLHQACAALDLKPVSVALRWLVHHSQMDGARGDGIILGASSLTHLQQNLSAVAEGPLPEEALQAIELANETALPQRASYAFRAR